MLARFFHVAVCSRRGSPRGYKRKCYEVCIKSFTGCTYPGFLLRPLTLQIKLIVATDTAFVPFEFKQGDQYVGFDVDLWAAIAKELKLDYTLKPMDFSGIVPALQTKNVDVALAGITITDARKKAIDFSDGYYKSGLLVMVKADNNDVKSVKISTAKWLQ